MMAWSYWALALACIAACAAEVEEANVTATGKAKFCTIKPKMKIESNKF